MNLKFPDNNRHRGKLTDIQRRNPLTESEFQHPCDYRTFNDHGHRFIHERVRINMLDFKTHKTDGGTLVIRVTGHLDHDSNQYFFQCVQDEIEAGHKKIVINFADLGYVSSVGLGALV
ncbi:MAG: STAS domain-containing protein, partial [Planctomycetota bacterium]